MATFETPSREQKSGSPEQYPYRLVDSAVQEFIIALRDILAKLNVHQLSLEKYIENCQWEMMEKEQIESSTTLKRLKAILQQLEETRAKVIPRDLPTFDSKLGDMRQRAKTAILEFLGSPSLHKAEPLAELRSEPTQNTTIYESDQLEEETTTVATSGEVTELQIQRQLSTERAPNQETDQSWQELKVSLVELDSLITEFASAVHTQQETVDHIEENITEAQVNVEEGVMSLGAANKLKSAMLPVAGALIGGVIGGPVGIVAGAKVGGLAAVTGGLAGFGGGHLMKRRQQQQNQVELGKLSSKAQPEITSESLPLVDSDPLVSETVSVSRGSIT